MAQAGARSASAHDDDRTRGVTTREDRRGLTPAQLYCLLAGLALLLAGLFGFIADASFDTSATPDTDVGGNTGGGLQGDSFLGFEVNGWHNVVHVASGLLLLAAFSRRAAAKTVALVFGLTYGAVAIIGLIDGTDVLGLIPVNPADNILHIALSLVGILAALASPADRDDLRTSTATPRDETARADGTSRFDRERIGTTTDPMTGRPFGERVNR
jgi:Domain of unknown function (DUF4383)